MKLFVSMTCLACVLATGVFAETGPTNEVPKITVQPDQAPDCSTLKSMVESVTRDCKTNDQKAVAIYNFMQLTHYHRNYPNEPGGVPVLKEINVYGWSLCGGLHSEQSALWRQLGWGWRFVGWDGHTTVEANYDDRWHYFDVFLKFYAWMPDGKGGRTIAGEDDLTKRSKELITDAFTLDKGRRIVYLNNNPYAMNAGKANWRAPSFLSCGDTLEGTIDGLKTHHGAGSPEGWAGINHADGSYKTDVNLAPGTALTNTWDPIPDAWYWNGNKTQPAHTCGGHKDTRNDPGIGLVLEPYINSKVSRCYGSGMITFAPDFGSDAVLSSFVSAENVSYANKTLAPAQAGSPGVVVFRVGSPYIMTKASGSAAGAEKVEVSTDGGKTYAPVTISDFSAAVRGSLSVLVKVTFKEPLKDLKVDAVVQNNPGALPYLSPGKNVVTVAAGDAKALGKNKLVVTYAYRLGSRTKSFDELCEQGKEIAKQHNATWSEKITYVQKTFTAQDLPAKMEIDCPTPKGQYPVYPRMMFLRREVLTPDAKPMALPEGALEAKAGENEELLSLPNPFMVGAEEPPVIKPRAVKTVEIPLSYVNYVDAKGTVAESGQLRWPKDPKEEGKVISGVVVIGGELKDLPTKNIAAARLCVPVLRGHASAPGQLGVVFLKEPVAKGAAIDFKTLPEAEGVGMVPKQPDGTPEYSPAKEVAIDITRHVKAIAGGEKFNGLALRMVPNRSVDDGYTVRCDISPKDPVVLKVDIYTDAE